MRKTKFPLWFDRQIQSGVIKQVGLLLVSAFAVLGVAAFFIYIFTDGHIGMANDTDVLQNKITGEQPIGFFWQLYYYFADPGNQMSMHAMNGTQRWIGLIVSTLGSFFLGGLLVSTFSNIISQRVDKINKGLTYYKFTGHTVIIGSDLMLHGIVRQLIARGDERIVVMTSTDVESLRKSIEANLENAADMERIVVNYGVRDSKDYLAKINITAAREVFILGDTMEFDDIESYHDTLNIQCLNCIARLCESKSRPEPLKCHVAFEYMTTYNIFQYADLSDETREYVDFRPFNPYENWAEKVLVSCESAKSGIVYTPLDQGKLTPDEKDKYVHFIIIGMSRMGQAMAKMAAHIAHYPNYREKKTRITIIDQNGRAEMDEFKQKCGELFEVSHSTFIDCSDPDKVTTKEFHLNQEKYGHLVSDCHDDFDRDFIDIDWQFIQGADNNPAVRKLLAEYAEDKNAIITVAVCLNITHISLRSAMHMPTAYYEKEIPIYVQQRNSSALVSTMKDTLYGNLRPFGMLYDCYNLQIQKTEMAARRINAAYSGIPLTDTESIDSAWANLPVTKHWSNFYSACTIPTKLRCCKGDIEGNLVCLAEMEHARWNVEELLLGWRPVLDKQEEEELKKIGKTKNTDKRYHIDIRPFDGLSKEEQKHDYDIIKKIPEIYNKDQL